jgi:hypothetical protein
MKYLLWIVAVVLLFVAGCQTLKGVQGDAAWLLQTGADNISTE